MRFKQRQVCLYLRLASIAALCLCRIGYGQTDIHLLYPSADAGDSPTMRLMAYTFAQIPDYRLKKLQAPMKRTVAMLVKPQQGKIFCSFGLFSSRESHSLSQARWSKVVAINPDSWTLVYNKSSAPKMKKYINAQGYFDESLKKITFAVDDLPETFYAIFRDPELRAGYAYDFSAAVPADIVANTVQIRSAQSGDQVLRMVEKGRLDVTGINSRIVNDASKRYGFKNVAYLYYLFDPSRLSHPYRHFGLMCNRNDSSDSFMDQFNLMLDQVRGDKTFVHMLMDDYFSPKLIQQSMQASAQLKAGAYDLSRIQYNASCAVNRTSINQSHNGGQWNTIATVEDPLSLTIGADGYGYTVADAVRFERLDHHDTVVQAFEYSSLDSSFKHRGFGLVGAQTAASSYGTNYRFDSTPSASQGRWAKWAPEGLIPGRYRVSLWWPKHSKRHPFPTDVPIDIAYGKDCREQIVDFN